MGSQVLVSTYTGTFTQTTSWTNLTSRLANIETGLVNGVTGAPYFKKTGDSIQPASGTVGLSLQTTAGSTNLLETKNAAGQLRFNVNFDGIPKVNTSNVLYVGSPDYVTLNDTAQTANTIAQGNPFNPFLLAGM